MALYPTKFSTAGWTPSRYGESYDLRISATLLISVSREIQNRDNPSPTPYAAIVFGARLKPRYATADEAKAAAIAFAKRQLKVARDTIGEIE